MNKLVLIIIALITSSCTSGFEQFYKPYNVNQVNPRMLEDVEFLQKGVEPTVYTSNDIDRDFKNLVSERYIPIGEASFNGGYEDENMVITQAKKVGATVALVSTKYTNTLTSNSSISVPDSSTTYHSGSVYGGGYYSGTSTSYGVREIPITTHQARYDQLAIFFVKSTKKPRFGVILKDLNNIQRVKIERNMGATISVVMKESPAFYANVISGDILAKINGIEVRDSKHADDLMGNISRDKTKAIFTVIRNGTEKEITLDLDNNG